MCWPTCDTSGTFNTQYFLAEPVFQEANYEKVHWMRLASIEAFLERGRLSTDEK